MRKKTTATTPVRRALLDGSRLLPRVKDGLGAIESSHHKHIETSVRGAFGDSLALDEALLDGHEEENRWDYLLGHTATGEVVALEPHSAKQDQVSKVIAKRRAARVQLREHLREGVHVSRWLRVASGNVDFVDTEKEKRILDQNGIQFVGRQVRQAHLPTASAHPHQPAKVKRKGKS